MGYRDYKHRGFDYSNVVSGDTYNSAMVNQEGRVGDKRNCNYNDEDWKVKSVIANTILKIGRLRT